MMDTILLVDDEQMNRVVASKILIKEGYSVIEAQNGFEALEALKTNQVSLILMDLMMPQMDGFEAITQIKLDKQLKDIPIIVISALSDMQMVHKGLMLGANEYITKPFDIVEFRLRVQNIIQLGNLIEFQKEFNQTLTDEVDKKTHELHEALQEIQQSEKDILAILAKLAEYRDNETSSHTIRVGQMAGFLGSKLGLDEEQCALLKLAAPMHDIGKVGIEDDILLKNGKLTEEEFSTMQQHANIGYSILSQKETPLLQLAATIAYTHHEKYDGSGYPRGLSKDSIPIEGAIVAIVDVYDALLSKRPYKEPFSQERALEIIANESGSHFDPKVHDAFVKYISQINLIRSHYED